MSRIIFFISLLIMYEGNCQSLSSFDKWIDYPVSSTYLKKAITAESFHGNNTWLAIQIDTSSSKKYQQLARLDIDGELIFAKEHYTHGYIYNIKSTPDDGCLLIGVTARGSYWVGWVAKCNALGDIEWSYSYGEPSLNIYLQQAVLAKNGNYVIAGDLQSGTGNGGIVAMEIDTLGNLKWVNYYDTGVGSTRLLARILSLDDGSYVLGSYYTDYPCYARFIRLKPNGEVWYHNTYKLLHSCWNWLALHDIVLIDNNQKLFLTTLSYFLTRATRVLILDSLGNIRKKDSIPNLYSPVSIVKTNTSNKYYLKEGPYSYNSLYYLDSNYTIKRKVYKDYEFADQVPSYMHYNNFIFVQKSNKNKKIMISKILPTDFDTYQCRDTLVTNINGTVTNVVDTVDALPTSKPTYTVQSLPYSSKNISLTIHTECSKALSIEENVPKDNSILVYPNPAQSYLYLQLPYVRSTVRIWDMYGKLVYEQQTVDVIHQINLETLSQGIYGVEVQTAQQKQFQKFIKID